MPTDHERPGMWATIGGIPPHQAWKPISSTPLLPAKRQTPTTFEQILAEPITDDPRTLASFLHPERYRRVRKYTSQPQLRPARPQAPETTTKKAQTQGDDQETQLSEVLKRRIRPSASQPRLGLVHQSPHQIHIAKTGRQEGSETIPSITKVSPIDQTPAPNVEVKGIIIPPLRIHRYASNGPPRPVPSKIQRILAQRPQVNEEPHKRLREFTSQSNLQGVSQRRIRSSTPRNSQLQGNSAQSLRRISSHTDLKKLQTIQGARSIPERKHQTAAYEKQVRRKPVPKASTQPTAAVATSIQNATPTNGTSNDPPTTSSSIRAALPTRHETSDLGSSPDIAGFRTMLPPEMHPKDKPLPARPSLLPRISTMEFSAGASLHEEFASYLTAGKEDLEPFQVAMPTATGIVKSGVEKYVGEKK